MKGKQNCLGILQFATFCFRYVVGKQYADSDQTVEILMNDLDPEVMAIFYKSNTSTAQMATKVGS